MSLPEILKTALPVATPLPGESNAGSVSTTKPVKNEFQGTPNRGRPSLASLGILSSSGNDKSDATTFSGKGKNPPKPPDEFYKDLQQFHEKRGTPITQAPKISGKPVDLHKLYSEVVERGGFQKVNLRDEWDEVLSEMSCLRERCVNATACLKLIYRRYLDKYERLTYFGEDPDKMEALEASIDPPETGGRSRSRYPIGISHSSSSIVNTVPMSYNYRQHMVSMEKRRHHKLSTDLYKHSPYEKLMLSLMSPLPNEQDFAINVCTLMTNEAKHTLKLNEYPKVLDVLLAHAGVFPDYTMRKLFNHVYNGVRKHSLYSFWRDLLHDKKEILELYTDEKDLESLGIDESTEDIKPIKDNAYIEECLEMDFLNLARGEGTQDYVGQRVQQVANILRNLSFFEENLYALAKNRTFLRFIVMSANIRWGNVHIHALEMAGNIASEIELSDPTIDELSRCLMGTLCDGIESSDRGVILNCLEILYKICSKEGNEEHVNRCLGLEFYKKLALFLSLNDIMLLIFTLEAVYALTSMGKRSCSLIMQVRGIVDQLVSLITVEAQSYGPDGCILMRVVETVPGNMLPMVAQNIANLQTVANVQKQSLPQHVGVQQVQQQIVPQAVPQENQTQILIDNNYQVQLQQQQQQQQQVQIQQQQFVQIPNQQNNPSTITNQTQTIIAVAPPPASSSLITAPAAAPPPPQQQPQTTSSIATATPTPNVTHNQSFTLEDEQYALSWLGATYEKAPTNDSHIEQNELYRMYLAHCQRSGKHSVVNHVTFPRLVRLIFNQSVGPVVVRKADGSELPGFHYVGMKARAQQLPIPNKTNPSTTTGATTGTIIKNDGQKKETIIARKTTKKKLKELQQQQQQQQQQANSNIKLPTVQQQQQQLQQQQQQSIIQSTGSVQVIGNPHIIQNTLEIPSTDSQQPQQQHQLQQNLAVSSKNVIETSVITKLEDNPASSIQVVETLMDIDEEIHIKPNDTSNLQTPEESSQAKSHLQQQTTINTIQQANVPEQIPHTNPSSSMIKSLLANKVNQRQQKHKDQTISAPIPATLVQSANTQQVIQTIQQQQPPQLQLTTNPQTIQVVGTPSLHLSNNPTIQGTIQVNNQHLQLSSTPTITSQQIIQTANIQNQGPQQTIQLQMAPQNPPQLQSQSNPPQLIAQSQPIKVPSNAISALVNNPLMQNASVKVGQTTIKPLHPQGSSSLEKKSLISESTPPPLAPLSGSNVLAKDSSGRSVIISSQMLLDAQAASSSGNIIKRKLIEDSSLHESKRIILEVEGEFEDDKKTAAKLYAEMAASILEDEDLEDIPPLSATSSSLQLPSQETHQQQQQLQPHQTHHQQQQQQSIIINPQPQSQQQTQLQNVQRQLVFQTPSNQNQGPTQIKLTGPGGHQIPTAMATIKTDQGLQTVILQKPLDQGQQLIQQVIQQPQQPQQTQYVLATNPQGQTYLVAQQTQPPPPQPPPTQTVLVTQTPQQQSTGAKTIIILQQQTLPTTSSHQQGQQQIITTGPGGATQKMIMTTPQGQQVLVTQRPQTPQQQIFINPQTGHATHVQHVSVPVSAGPSTVVQRQLIQTSSSSGNQTQTTGTGQISPSLLSQLNQIPATIKIHQPQSQQATVLTQSSQHSRLGKTVTLPTKTPGAPLPLPPLQQHQSIIQQHIISGPSEKRQVILGAGGRAIEIKETVITQTQPPPQQTHLNSQTIITTTPLPNAILQQSPQPQPIRTVIEQHPSIIQQKISVPIPQSSTQTSNQASVVIKNESGSQSLPTLIASKTSLPSTSSGASTSHVMKKVVPSGPSKSNPGSSVAGGPNNRPPGGNDNTPGLPGGSINQMFSQPKLIVQAPASTATTTATSQSQSINTTEHTRTFTGESSTSATATATVTSATMSIHTSSACGSASTSVITSNPQQTQTSTQASPNPTPATTPAPPSSPSPAAAPPAPATPPAPPAPPIDMNWLYICDWRNCPRRKFKSLNDLQHHVCAVHCPDHLDPGAEIYCQWGPGPGLCDSVPRKRFSLMTHLIDRHLTTDNLRAAVQRRITTGQHNMNPPQPPVTIVRNIDHTQRNSTASPALSSSSSTSSTNVPSTAAGSSAMHAIKRHSADFINPKELMDENEGPVTKSIRLTSALILRNLVTYTGTAKKSLRRYESQLSNVALSNVESSGTIAHILYELNN